MLKDFKLKNKLKFARLSRGFTIIEIMVVIAIIGILVAIVMESGAAAKSVARDNQRLTDIRLLQIKLEAYKGDHGGVYPSNPSDPAHTLDLLMPSYISNGALPKDPKTNSEYHYVPLQFSATSAGCGASYHLGADLENSNTALQTAAKGMSSALVACTGYSDFTLNPTTYDVVSPNSFVR